eukprot:m.234394 g.234394  ORF g.234394 m.234394 type:complete len:74 (-) comp17087_c1_seq1:386-607(-)
MPLRVNARAFSQDTPELTNVSWARLIFLLHCRVFLIHEIPSFFFKKKILLDLIRSILDSSSPLSLFALLLSLA